MTAIYPDSVVVATTKVRIFKQITTYARFILGRKSLLLLPQRYVFSSKSQPAHMSKPLSNGCCCYHKGTYFQANHNNKAVLILVLVVVVATTKVRIFKQITTQVHENHFFCGCCCYHKGTYFQANHNLDKPKISNLNVVVATTKVRIFKQITTMLLSSISLMSCCCYHKGTYFQANHNLPHLSCVTIHVVVATTKVRIFKQITTGLKTKRNLLKLLLLPQRYVFSSKSQQSSYVSCKCICCCCYHKGTYFQANHNSVSITLYLTVVVVATTKVRIFKQITTVGMTAIYPDRLLLLPQRYVFSSKSQR